MTRLTRYVIPGQPQHIIQRGNNRQVIFAVDADYQFFHDVLVEAAHTYALAIHAYARMTNHSYMKLHITVVAMLGAQFEVVEGWVGSWLEYYPVYLRAEHDRPSPPVPDNHSMQRVDPWA